MTGDVIALEDEPLPGNPLLNLVMDDGRRIARQEPLEAIRTRTTESLQQLPENLRAVDAKTEYPVELSAGVRKLAEEADR